ncbi:HAMP domain-containing sensor histidine kinase [Salinisphaera sp. PC39]|uniref:sensor histidine kinase n=1 Tax=Salinisphaera sp. PC39 TaxID=1304156 RepID=UPI003342DE13
MRHSLQFRVAAAMIVIVGGVCSMFAVAVLIASDRLEDRLLEEITEHEADEFVTAWKVGSEEPPDTYVPSAYVRTVLAPGPADPAVPDALRGLAPGHHDDIAWGDDIYHVYVRNPDGSRLYLAYEMTALERRETVFQWLIWSGVALALALATLAGALAARPTLAPIARLAARVRGLPAEARGLRLAPEFDTPETIAIARAFDRYLARLDDLIERERDFTTDASHELRTPLAVIRSNAELLSASVPGDARVRARIERINRAAEQMTELIEALLLLAREEDGGELVDLEALLHEIVSGPSLPPDSEDRLCLEVESPLAVRAPRAAVSTVIHNLVRNALRHAPAGEVRISLRRRRLEVADSGPGMPADVHRAAFDRGFQAGPSAGLGFGLYISKRLCDRFGWQIRLADAVPSGTLAIVQF